MVYSCELIETGCFCHVGAWLMVELNDHSRTLRPRKSEEFENGVSSLKAHQMSCVHTTPKKKHENATTSGQFGLFLTKTRREESHDYCHVIIFKKLGFQHAFRPHYNVKTAFPNSSGLKSGDGLVWTVGLTVEIKLSSLFKISGVVWTRQRPTFCNRC